MLRKLRFSPKKGFRIKKRFIKRSSETLYLCLTSIIIRKQFPEKAHIKTWGKKATFTTYFYLDYAKSSLKHPTFII